VKPSENMNFNNSNFCRVQARWQGGDRRKMFLREQIEFNTN